MYDKLLLSPGENTKQFIEKDNRKREYQRNFKQSTEYKRRRRELKFSITQQTSTSEIKEGATYEPAVDLQCPECPTEEIPSQILPPQSNAHLVPKVQNTFLYFDFRFVCHLV